MRLPTPTLDPATLSPDRRTQISSIRQRYRSELYDRVLPFWMEHSIDRENGGYYNCLDRDGAVYDTTKHSWLQGRQVWMFSALYRTVEPRDEWLDIAQHGLKFLRDHALRPNGQVFFSLTADGRPIYQQRKIFSECFYVMALAEYARAADRPDLLKEAEEGLGRLWEWSSDLTKVGRPQHEGQADARSLAIPMILLNLIDVVAGENTSDYASSVDKLLERILLHVHADDKMVLESVAPDGSRLDGADGRVLNPGHAIEAGWFVQHWAQRLSRPDLQETARDIVRWSFDRGWDDEHGGIFYFLDADGYSPMQLEWFMKLWWPHCEALYAHLLNYALFGDEEDWQAFKTVDTYTFDHFSDPEHGEWFGYLDREGRVTHRFKGAAYKGCFHVPRTLWLCERLLGMLDASD
ncbi:N-acylglucosamine 2-epimerase [Longibacter salinarum]|uniref:N-acylglucosamine 2-epimerase n=1 Tax=Longibacter salinarum TaxID=1850348 RepID=A0A2A8D055_9BACT|nr:AGE family epimerase/isomerase [Longibacter salinarum]PEN14241.1 N-acylglucosamine 2-epimerase [Longibacter salinarum]